MYLQAFTPLRGHLCRSPLMSYSFWFCLKWAHGLQAEAVFSLSLPAEFNVQLSFHGLNTFVLSEQWKRACLGRKGSPLGEKLYFHNQELCFLVQVQLRINEPAAGLSSPELQFEVSGTFQGVRWNFWFFKPQTKTSLRTPSWPTFTQDFLVTFLKIARPNWHSQSTFLRLGKTISKVTSYLHAWMANQCSIVLNFTWQGTLHF